MDANRNLDALANMNLGSSEGEEDEDAQIVQEGIGHLASMLPSGSKNRTSASEPKAKKKLRTTSKYAEKCMYAELLELNKDPEHRASELLPQDLQTNWIALSPVPKGKRCLAVAHLSNGNPTVGQLQRLTSGKVRDRNL